MGGGMVVVGRVGVGRARTYTYVFGESENLRAIAAGGAPTVVSNVEIEMAQSAKRGRPADRGVRASREQGLGSDRLWGRGRGCRGRLHGGGSRFQGKIEIG